jgi:glutathione-regulated potassium-efflux system protein KefB
MFKAFSSPSSIVPTKIRDTIESAYLMRAEGLRASGLADIDIEEAAEDVRQRDSERLSEQV